MVCYPQPEDVEAARCPLREGEFSSVRGPGRVKRIVAAKGTFGGPFKRTPAKEGASGQSSDS
jgi:hypothetical protein